MRILVTGSRDWDDYATLLHAVRRAILSLAQAPGYDGTVTVVHGACPSGADAMAHEVATFFGCKIERHPADWDTHRKRAGYVRNAEMVGLGADVCLAFIRNGSRGASMTADLAEKAGIPTIRYTA